MITQEKRRLRTAPAEQASKGISWRRLFGSAAIWLVFWLAIADVALGYIKPLRYVDVPTYIFDDQDPMDDKARELLSPYNNYNVLLLGSSLLAATAGADFLGEHFYRPSSSWNFHTKSHVLDTMLQQRFNAPAQSFNMGIAACMIAEDKLILDKALEAGKHPRLLMLFLAPRDFIDNSHKPKAHVYKYFVDRRPFWTKLSMDKPMQANFESAAASISNLYRSRGHYMKVLEMATCAALHRAPNLFYANQGEQFWTGFRAPKLIIPLLPKNKPDMVSKEDATQKMGKYYEVAYIPVNYGRFDDEMSALHDLLNTAQRHKILAVVVNMPRGDVNEQMLPGDFRATYMRKLAATCTDGRIKYINFEGSPSFGVADFSDGVHLTPQGGTKFFNLLGAELAGDPAFAQQLKQALSGH